MSDTQNPPRKKTSPLGRRTFLGLTAAGLSGMAIGCKGSGGEAPSASSTPTSSAGTGPETPEVNFGMIALTDCAPIVVAHERGYFARHGIRATIVKGASWAAIRDSLTNGSIHATHMLLGMPLASTMGLLGSPRVPMVAPWILNRNGQAITLKSGLRGRVQADARALKPLVDQAKASGSPMTFAMTFPPGTHATWLRYWLASGGIHPDRDIALVTVPPPQMVANMRVDRMDGFCVGEPWNARAIADGIGYTAVTTQEIWPDHPEKVLAFREDWAASNPRTVRAVLRALHEASVWLDDVRNRPALAEMLSRTTYVNCQPEVILGRLQGNYDYGDGRTKQDDHYMIFNQRGANVPQPKLASWYLTQFRRWGMVPSAPDYDGIARRVMKLDVYGEAMRELGLPVPELDTAAFALADGKSFDPANPEAYATSFDVHALASS